MSKPILYEQGTTVFNSNGLGVLSKASDCFVTERTSGFYELEMAYPVTGKHFQLLEPGRVILAKPNDTATRWQPFTIYDVQTANDGIAHVYAEHAKYKLRGIPVPPFKAESAGAAAGQIQSGAIGIAPFEIWTDISTSGTLDTRYPRSASEVLWGDEDSFLSIYGGEPEFDQYTVKLHNRRGSDSGITIRHRKNLVDLNHDKNLESGFTAVYPFWYNSQDGSRVELPEKVLKSKIDYGYTRVKMLDLSADFPEKPTEEQLRQKAQEAVAPKDIGLPKISMEVKYAAMQRDGAPVERISLYDTVTVQHPVLHISRKARVVGLRYDVLRDRVDSVQIGEAQATLADTIKDQQQELQKKPSTSDVQRAQEAATTWLTNGVGYFVVRRNAEGIPQDILFLDTPDINTAVNILRVGQSGIGFSHSGVGGPYVSAWTIDGKFVADWITTGTLVATLIKLMGAFEVHGTRDGKDVIGGRLGFLPGISDEGKTDGIGVSSPDGSNFVGATTGGTIMRSGDSILYLVPGGRAELLGDLYISGQIHQHAAAASLQATRNPEAIK